MRIILAALIAVCCLSCSKPVEPVPQVDTECEEAKLLQIWIIKHKPDVMNEYLNTYTHCGGGE